MDAEHGADTVLRELSILRGGYEVPVGIPSIVLGRLVVAYSRRNAE